MDFVIENWYILATIAVMAVVAAVLVVKFFKNPREEQVAKVKEWLLAVVVEMEKKFGSGTGKLKLRSAYDLFVARFPWVAKAVSFDTFAVWVDEALGQMHQWLDVDEPVADYVYSSKEG